MMIVVKVVNYFLLFHLVELMIFQFTSYYSKQSFITDSLSKPSDPPVLTSKQSIYNVEFPMELETNMYQNPSLLFRIEHFPGQFVYQWMLDITIDINIMMVDLMLDLSSYPTESSINVSFAYATAEHGISNYSDPATLPGRFILTPSSLSDTSHSVVTASAQEARVTALCHVVCINYLTANFNAAMNGTSDYLTNNSSSHYNTMITVSL